MSLRMKYILSIIAMGIGILGAFLFSIVLSWRITIMKAPVVEAVGNIVIILVFIILAILGYFFVNKGARQVGAIFAQQITGNELQILVDIWEEVASLIPIASWNEAKKLISSKITWNTARNMIEFLDNSLLCGESVFKLGRDAVPVISQNFHNFLLKFQKCLSEEDLKRAVLILQEGYNLRKSS